MSTTDAKIRNNGAICREPAVPDQHTMQGQEKAVPDRLGIGQELLRWVSVCVYFFTSAISIHVGQWVGTPLYFINKKAWYDYMALTKRAGSLLILTITQWWSPTIARVSGDASVAGQMRLDKNGSLRCDFPERMVITANHQIYTDWSYLWWIAYTADAHGRLYIMLKDSIKWIPILGIGLQFFGFIFMSRKWVSDESRMLHRMEKLNDGHGTRKHDPMWLLVFPEGTNLSARQRAMSAKFAAKTGQDDMIHTVLPRSTGLLCCLRAVRHSVDWLYDCTIAYEGISHGQYSAERYTIRSTYFKGQQPRSVNMHWRRFKISDMPLDDKEAFHDWITARWREKDQLIETYINTGCFPSLNSGKSDPAGPAYLESPVRLRHPLGWMEIYTPFAIGLAVIFILRRVLSLLW